MRVPYCKWMGKAVKKRNLIGNKKCLRVLSYKPKNDTWRYYFKLGMEFVEKAKNMSYEMVCLDDDTTTVTDGYYYFLVTEAENVSCLDYHIINIIFIVL